MSKSMLPSLPAQPFKGLSLKALPSNLHLYLMGLNVSDGPLVSETSRECSFFQLGTLLPSSQKTRDWSIERRVLVTVVVSPTRIF